MIPGVGPQNVSHEDYTTDGWVIFVLQHERYKHSACRTPAIFDGGALEFPYSVVKRDYDIIVAQCCVELVERTRGCGGRAGEGTGNSS